MDFHSRLLEVKKKIERLDVAHRKIIVWGMGHTAAMNENAFKAEQTVIYAYTATDAKNNRGGAVLRKYSNSAGGDYQDRRCACFD